MYRNLVVINYKNKGVGLSHDPATGACKVKEFDTEHEYSSNGGLAVAGYYMNSVVEAGLDKVRFNMVSLDDVCIKGFTIAKLRKEDPTIDAEGILDYLIQDFHEEESIAAIAEFVQAYLLFTASGHEIQFRKASDVQKAKAYPNTLTETQQTLVNKAWETVMPNKELVFEVDKSAGGLL